MIRENQHQKESVPQENYPIYCADFKGVEFLE